MKRLIVPVLALALFGQGCLADPPQPNHPIIFKSDDPTPVPGTFDDLTIPSSSGVNAPPVKTGEISSASKNVVVTSIVAKQTLPNPFVILGRAVSFENVVNWRVRDANGNEIAKGAVITSAPDVGQFGAFRVRSFYSRLPTNSAGTVEVFTLSPRDGSEQDRVSIPVVLNREISSVKVFFANEKEDPGLLHCETTYPVTRRLPKTTNVAEVALLELLKGPTGAEQITGSRTALLPGAELRSIVINDDTATVDFSQKFALGIAGSCNVSVLRSQVEQTLKQFTQVKKVKILVEGADAEQYLQP